MHVYVVGIISIRPYNICVYSNVCKMESIVEFCGNLSLSFSLLYIVSHSLSSLFSLSKHAVKLT